MTVPLARQWVKERAIAICEFAVFVARFARQWTKEQGNAISEFVFFFWCSFGLAVIARIKPNEPAPLSILKYGPVF